MLEYYNIRQYKARHQIETEKRNKKIINTKNLKNKQNYNYLKIVDNMNCSINIYQCKSQDEEDRYYYELARHINNHLNNRNSYCIVNYYFKSKMIIVSWKNKHIINYCKYYNINWSKLISFVTAESQHNSQMTRAWHILE